MEESRRKEARQSANRLGTTIQAMDDDGPVWKRILGFFFNQPTRFDWRGGTYNGATDSTLPWWAVVLIAIVVVLIALIGWRAGS